MSDSFGARPNGRVLLVASEPRLSASLRELLELSRLEVIQPRTAESASKLIASGQFDCLVLDQQVSGSPAFLALAKAAATRSVVLGNVRNVDAALTALRAGALDFLAKPFNPDTLIRSIHGAVAQARSVVPLPVTMDSQSIWLKFLANTSPDIVYALDTKGCFTYVNATAEALLGIKSHELVGRHYSDIVHEGDRERARWVFDERRTGKRASAGLEVRLVGRARQDDPFERRSKVLSVVLNSSGIYRGQSTSANFVGSCGFARDVSDRKRSEDQVYRRAYHDLLTGLPNRLLLRDHLMLAMANAKRTKGCLAIMFIDLDRFKQVNDTLGHGAGDQLLQAVAARLLKSIRAGDTLARLGGDEFVAVLPHITNRDAAAQAARKLLDELTTPFSFGKRELFIGASIGVSFYPDDANDAEALIRNADLAMYDAKSQGRNTFVFYSPEKHAISRKREDLEQELDNAIRNDELALYYQPQIDARNKNLIGMEALLRWQHPKRGVISAEEFIATAEDTNSIVTLGEWVLRSALDQVRQWHTQGLNGFNLALNVSVRQLQSAEFLRRFAQQLRAYEVDPSKIVVEVSETNMVRDPDLVLQRLKTLSQLGVRLCIDNFGTGGASFNYLRSLPVNAVKLDRSLIKELRPDEGEHPIPRAMVLVAKGMHVELLAHGVENEYQLDFLVQNDCHAWQGYLYAQPLSAAAATQLLTARAMGRDTERKQ